MRFLFLGWLLCRWQLPQTEHSVSASTANELRQDRDAPINPEKLKAAAEGLKQGRFALFSQWPNSYHSVHAIAVRKELINLFFFSMKNKLRKKRPMRRFIIEILIQTNQEYCFHTKTCLEMLGMSLNKFTSWYNIIYVLYDSTAYGCLTLCKIVLIRIHHRVNHIVYFMFELEIHGTWPLIE